MSKFTKGPWEVTNAGPQQDKKQLFGEYYVFSDAHCIANISTDPCGVDEVAEANARFIAAA